ncbi:BapA/Bap/LapF family prefix-like domain-containing protein [Thioclava sp.]|uniref:BapA/Bap/LapF family prefix-like domain-containing protein n=1 Tax=Thioclava sp. TaxID=1933450 RepID=UPI003AA905D5
MVKSVDFAVRDSAGGVVYGSVAGEGGGAFVQMGAGEDISLNLRRASILKYTRDGGDLLIDLADGRVITLSGFFAPGEGQENHLMISADGELAQVSLEDMGDGVMFASYGEPEVSGDKWSPNDRLAFLDGDELLAPVVEDETTGMAAFAPALLGGFGGVGAAGAAAAGLAGAAVIGGGGGGSNGSGSGPIIPTVNDPNSDSTLTTNTENPEAVVSGTGEPGSTVDVTIGDQTEQTEIDDDGNWEVIFKDDTLPADGDYSSEVVVTAPDGTEYPLDGPDFLIDMTPPAVEITEGAESTGDVENLEEYADGISITGQGEAGASISVEVQGQTQQTTVGEDSSWSVTFPQDQLPGGTYTTEMTVVATDIHGNTTTITDNLMVDTEVTLTQTMTPGGADGVVNATELTAGVSIGGAVDAGSTVVVTLADGTTVPGTVTNGSWSATIPSSYLTGEGTASYTVSATDPNGNFTSLPGTVTYDIELNNLTFSTNTPNSQIADNVVNGAEGTSGVAVTGTVEPGAQSVTLTLANGTNVPTTIAANGSWSANIPASFVTGEGTLNYTVNAIDGAGNTLSTPMSGSVKYDTLVNQFTLNGATGGADGVVNASEANSVTVGGTVEAGSTVVLTLADGSTVNAQVTGTSWTASLPSAQMSGEGVLNYSAMATDAYGNSSNALAGTVTYDTELNNLSVTTATPNSQIADGVVNASEGASGILMTGTVEAGAQSVTLTLANGTTVQGAISGSSWSATIPASMIASSEGTLNYTLNAVDAHGNTLSTPISGAINYDTVVTNFSETGQVAGDDVVNATEAAAGYTISGTVEAGSDVVVHMNGHDYTASVQGNNWSVTLGADDLGATSGTMTYTVSATDTHGNTAILNDGDGNDLSFTFDLEAPDAPNIINFTSDGDDLLGLQTNHAESALSFSAVDAQGLVSEVGLQGGPIEIGDQTAYFFSPPVPNGSYLVVSDTDVAGNEASTLLVVDNQTAVNIDLSRGGLSGFDFSSIDLTFAPDATLTITDSQIQSLTGPDHTITIQGDANDHVTAIGAQDTGTDVTVDGHTHSVYSLGDSTLIVDDEISNLTI